MMSAPAISRPAAVRRHITLADRTLGNIGPLKHLAIASELGYDGVSLRINPSADHRAHVPAGSQLMRDVRRSLADGGLYVLDAESVRLTPDWTLAQTEPFLAACGELGARFLVVVADDSDEARVAANIAQLAEATEIYGTRIIMEFMVYLGIGSLAQVTRVLDAVGRSDTAILIDALHLHRAGSGPADIAAIDPARLPYFQICDAPKLLPGADFAALRQEARIDRLLPGDGGLPLLDLELSMPREIPIAVEAPSARLLEEFGDLEVCRRALNATRRLLQAADQAENQKIT